MKRWKSTIPADRLSDLPQAIIHQILSLLPAEEATRTSALSKTFYSCWNSYPVIDLYNSRRSSTNTTMVLEDFTDLVNRTIQRRNQVKQVSIRAAAANTKEGSFFHPRTIPHMSSITTLKLTEVPLYYFNRMDLHLPALEILLLSWCHGLKHFNFCSTRIRSIEIDSCAGLQSVIIESSSLETFCLLEDCKCKIIDISECKSLKNLTLAEVNIENSWIAENLHNFVHLKNLEIYHCIQLKNPRIANDNLKILDVETEDDTIQSIELAAANLQVLSLNVLELRSIGTISFMHLTSIKLGNRCPQEFVMEFLKERVPKFIRLETLMIDFKDWNLHGIEITNKHLKRLVLSLESRSKAELVVGEITLNTPKLVSLKYQGRSKPAFRVLSHTDLLDTELKIWRCSSSDYFVKLRDMIQTFSHSKLVKLSSWREEDLVFSEELRRKLIAPISDCKHVEVELVVSWEKNSIKLVDSILWLFPSLQTLRLISRGGLKNKSMKFQHHSTREEADGNKHWRFSLKIVEFNNFEAVERADLENHFMKKG